MRKTILSALVLSGLIANAQDYKGSVGVNTETPRATLEVKAITVDGRAQGILFPHIDETQKNSWTIDNTKGLVAGTTIWNTTKTCLDVFNGTNWTCTDGSKTNTHGTPWTDVSDKWQNAPWMKLSNGVVNAAQTGFVPYDGIGTLPEASKVKYMNWNDAMVAYGSTTTFAGGQYSLPTKEEWTTILPENSNYVYYSNSSEQTNKSETNSLGTFTNDYKNMGGTITYAVRFKGNDDLKSAWKYEYISGKGLKITIVNLKVISQHTTTTISTISNESFWSSIPSTAKREIFLPAYGFNGDIDYGSYGSFWSSTEHGSYSSNAWNSYFYSGLALTNYYYKTVQIPVFLVKRN